MSGTRNEGFLSIVESNNKGTIEMAALECESCDCYDCDYNCQECDTT
jgi:hypothetical protein